MWPKYCKILFAIIVFSLNVDRNRHVEHARPTGSVPKDELLAPQAKQLMRLFGTCTHESSVDDLRRVRSMRQRRCRLCEPVRVYWKVDQIQTSYYLLHSTYANSWHHLPQFVRFSSDDELHCVLCSVCRTRMAQRRIHFAGLCIFFSRALWSVHVVDSHFMVPCCTRNRFL